MDCFEPNESTDCFIFSKDFSLQEDEEMEFIEFYDSVGKNSYNLINKNDKLYICVRVNNYGSLFYGNYVVKGKIFYYNFLEPISLVIKEIDPILLFVNVIHGSTYNVS